MKALFFHHLRWTLVLSCLGMGFLTMPVSAQTLTFEDVLNKALAASYDLRLNQVDIRLGKTAIKSARSGYFPNIRGRLNSEYLHDFQADEQVPIPTVAVGDTVIPSGTRYQNSIGFSLSQTLLDFGSTRRRVDMEKKEVAIQHGAYDQSRRDLKVKLVDVYRDALIQEATLKIKGRILELAQQVYGLKKRLFEAGTLSRTLVADEALEVAQTLEDIRAAQNQLQLELENLGFYTQEQYTVEGVALQNFRDVLGPDSPDIVRLEDSPEARIYALEIEKKQREIEILKRRYLPQVALYSYYNLYGFDQDAWRASLKDLRNRTLSAGISIILPVFDGFKNQADIERARLEKEKLVIEREQKLAELRYQASLAFREMDSAEKQLNSKSRHLWIFKEKNAMTERLSEQQLVDRTLPIKDEIRALEQQLDIDITNIERLAALTKLRILAEG